MSTWTPADITDQTGRTFVITGANSGIGLGAAKALAAKGAKVAIFDRDVERERIEAGDVEAIRALALAARGAT